MQWRAIDDRKLLKVVVGISFTCLLPVFVFVMSQPCAIRPARMGVSAAEETGVHALPVLVGVNARQVRIIISVYLKVT